MYKTFSRSNALTACSILILFLWIACSSCGNTRQLIYMQGKFDTAKLSQLDLPEPVIQKGDVISIIVYSDNPDATKIYNQTLITTASGAGGAGSTAMPGGQDVAGTSPTSAGYLVDQGGNIQFQGIGILHVEGLTRPLLQDTLLGRLKNYLVNPYFNIKFLNYKFTMLGEVQRPGIFSIPGDRVNLFQALGMAGDMTFYGRRDNILVMRENNGKREWARLDITKPEIVASPYFYLRSNDVVIIEPTKKRVVASDQVTMRNISIATSIVSTLAIIYSIFRR